MVRIQKALNDRKLKTQMLLQIHDELLFEVPKSEIETVTPLIKETMETVVTLPVALPVVIAHANDWLTAH